MVPNSGGTCTLSAIFSGLLNFKLKGYGLSRIFVSTSSKDLRFVEQAIGVIKQLGHQTFYFKEDIKVGNTWPNKMAEGLEWADYVICFVSESFATSRFCMDELAYAYALKKLIIVKLDDYQLPGQYRVQQRLIDLRDQLLSSQVSLAVSQFRRAFEKFFADRVRVARLFDSALHGGISIIDLLGMHELLEEEKKMLLREFEDTLWEDIFTEHVSITLTDMEVAEYEQVLLDESTTDHVKRDIVFDWLLDQVEDLPSIIQLSVDRLKNTLLGARIEGLKEYYSVTKKNLNNLRTVRVADACFKVGDIARAVEVLASIPPD